jgi:antitoxin HigA-1
MTSCRRKSRYRRPSRFGLTKLFGDGAGIWARMQAAYDTWHAERTEDVRHIPTIKAKAA